MTRRAELEEAEIARLVELAHCASITVRVMVDIDGNATFAAGGLGTFLDVASLEQAIRDSAAAVLSATLNTYGHACCPNP